MDPSSRTDTRTASALLFLCACAATAIGYTNSQSYSVRHSVQTGYTDSRDYMAMAQAQPVHGVRGARPLVPWIVSHVPGLPGALFNPGSQAAAERTLARRFGMVNAVFLTGTCGVLLLIFRTFNLTWQQTAAGLAMFLSAPPVVMAAGLPMVDTAFWFFLAAALLAVQLQRPLLYLGAVTIGVFAKELVLLALPIALVSRLPIRTRAMFVAASLPAVAAVVALRMAGDASALPGLSFTSLGRNALDQLREVASLHGLIDIVLAFGLAWIPAVAAFRHPVPTAMRPWLLLVPLVVLGEVFLGSRNIARNFFAAFPAVMPLAALGVSRWMNEPARAAAPEGTTGA